MQPEHIYFILLTVKKDSTVQILLVEDNPGDIRLTIEALKESQVKNYLHVVKDGVEAIEFLRKRGKYELSPTPDLILLDLNLPRKDGREVLAEIKTDENLKMIPVVILTTSEAEQDIIKSYKLHANCFITKPADLDDFIYAIRQIENFWFTVVKLPPENHERF
ncbi:MAG: response regulator [Fimbriimonadaceae bacterium]|nr:response regulator [Chitinophagales bacterium]